jgi:PAS domain S-box-containing protein
MEQAPQNLPEGTPAGGRSQAGLDERYRTLVETSPDAITWTDMAGRIVAANRRTFVLHGCADLEDFRATFPTAWEILVEDDRSAAAETARRVLEEGVLEYMHYRAYRKDRTTFPIELSASVIRDAGGAPVGFMAVSRNLDERRVEPHRARRAAAPPPPAPTNPEPISLDLGDRSALVAEPSMERIFQLLRTLAGSDLPVLLLGETGSGKEVAAYALHHWSPRRGAPFLTLNCAAVPESLVESEFFGYERGAFSGAVTSKPGLFESAHGGTVFLDEVGDLAPAAQAKLLRALETRRTTRLGGVRERELDVRIVAATNRELANEVEAARFRKDLLYRLGAAQVMVPPLRDRPREIPLLARHFLGAARARAGHPPVELGREMDDWLLAHPWPGNVRELKHLMEYVAVTVAVGPVEPSHLPQHDLGRRRQPDAPAAGAPATAERATASPVRRLPDELRDFERRRIHEALDAAGWVQRRAAVLLGMPLRTFQLRLRQFGISTRRRARE